MMVIMSPFAVYLPPCYKSSSRRYPVLYLQDGQNLFDAATAFAGVEWGVDDTADALIATGEIEPLIVVGIHNAGEDRIDEYTPTRDPALKRGGKSYTYGKMLIEQLKPKIDRAYRTLTGPKHTGLGGSSLGALVSLELGLRYEQVFGKLALHSPSVWWDNRFILTMLEEARVVRRARIWLDVGTQEGSNPEVSIGNIRLLRDRLVEKGWRLGKDLAYHEASGADHSERSWAQRVAPMLRYLFPPGC
jgi:predicted alpha/beta superfamily hydrolase